MSLIATSSSSIWRDENGRQKLDRILRELTQKHDIRAFRETNGVLEIDERAIHAAIGGHISLIVYLALLYRPEWDFHEIDLWLTEERRLFYGKSPLMTIISGEDVQIGALLDELKPDNEP